MRIIGFNFTKVSAERAADFVPGSEINTNIDFIEIEKEETDLAKDNNEAIRVSFQFNVFYRRKEKKEKEKGQKNGEISLTGFIILLAPKEEAKELYKYWKKKELPASFKVPIFNFLLKKCSTRALQLEEELNLPLHIPMPRLKQSQEEK
ncbi:MAG: hypothetical protein QXS38_00330 [Candidatus Pacearchaeota archaeon]